MDVLFLCLLVLHIAGGSIGLITGTLNLVRKKGGDSHKRIGKLFVYGMMVAGFTALAMSILHNNIFLFIVGVFTIYLVGTGNRYIYLKMLGHNQKPKMIDWVISLCMLVAGIAFIGFGIKQLLGGVNFGIVFLVFGSISLLSVRTDLRNYKGRFKEKNFWLLLHLQRMTAGYIAALTAFLVVNIKYAPVTLPSVLVWLLPTIILTPLIILWSRKYRVKAKGKFS